MWNPSATKRTNKQYCKTALFVRIFFKIFQIKKMVGFIFYDFNWITYSSLCLCELILFFFSFNYIFHSSFILCYHGNHKLKINKRPTGKSGRFKRDLSLGYSSTSISLYSYHVVHELTIVFLAIASEKPFYLGLLKLTRCLWS